MAWIDSGIDENDTNSGYEGEFWEPDINDPDTCTLQGTVVEDPKKDNTISSF